ncbi:hypothetical protein [Hoeflea sp.]|uniref:hypothetical protein n=1 Tax=Hoeflea sp. TaxID=1940281 RepID=UPI003B028E76
MGGFSGDEARIPEGLLCRFGDTNAVCIPNAPENATGLTGFSLSSGHRRAQNNSGINLHGVSRNCLSRP